jgi:hypothetical protein
MSYESVSHLNYHGTKNVLVLRICKIIIVIVAIPQPQLMFLLQEAVCPLVLL